MTKVAPRLPPCQRTSATSRRPSRPTGTRRRFSSRRHPNSQEVCMRAVTGITGKVGGTVAQTLLAAGEKVRAVVRDEAKGRAWAEQGGEIVLASIGDAE